MSTPTTARVIRASAVYDLLATAAFALPWTAPHALDSLIRIHEAWGLSGTLPRPDDVFTVLIANLLGSIVLVWSALRIAQPRLLFGAADTVARVLFSAWMVAALLAGASTAVLVFLVPELLWAVVQGFVVLRASRGPSLAP